MTQNEVAVFDMDGTLIDSMKKMKRDVINAMQRLGHLVKPEEVVGNFYDLAAKYGYNRQQFDAEFDKRKSWEQALRDGDAPIFEDTIPCLEQLKERGIRMVILSKSLPRYTQAKIDHFNLGQYFERSVVVNPGVRTKKHGAIYLVSEMLPQQIERIYFIGDRLEDTIVDKDVYEELNIPSHGILLRRNGENTSFPDDRYRFHRYYARTLAEVPNLIREGVEEL